MIKTIQDLLDELDLIEDKTKEVYLNVEQLLGGNEMRDHSTHDIQIIEHEHTVEIGGYED